MAIETVEVGDIAMGLEKYKSKAKENSPKGHFNLAIMCVVGEGREDWLSKARA